ncbi:MAG: tRNA pseudouridine(38-40) synthase TruA [Acholeplasmatales bacterium]|nr:MAG: tRNA pseudouridine(38-40) synthase TruA [Acholeplasmatales bacterium]
MVSHLIEAWQSNDWPKLATLLAHDCALSWFEEGLVHGPDAVVNRLSEHPVSVQGFELYLSYTIIKLRMGDRPVLVKVVTSIDAVMLLVVVAPPPGHHRIRFTMAYDGSRYRGFQRQPQGGAIQNVLEAALVKLFKHPLSIHAASRTDAGVHARKQVFHADLPAMPNHLADLLDRMLPDDLHVYGAEVVPHVFHSRYDARKKTYRYRLIHQVDPFLSHQALVHQKLDVHRLNTQLELFVGCHDFRAFTVRNDKIDTVRTVYAARAFSLGDETIIEWIGDGFLRHMVRMMVGHVLHDLCHDVNTVHAMLAEPLKPRRAMMAPAKGLYLHDIEY